MRALVALIVAALAGFFIYRLYLARVQPETPGTAVTQAISFTGVRNDLNAIAQAERLHLAQHGAYAPLDQLISSGALQMSRTQRDGYTYEIQIGGNGFTATARYTGAATGVVHPTFVVDQTMQIRQLE